MYPASVGNSAWMKFENEAISSKSKVQFVESCLVSKPDGRRRFGSLAKSVATISPFMSRSLKRFVILGQVHETGWQTDTAGKDISFTLWVSTAKQVFLEASLIDLLYVTYNSYK